MILVMASEDLSSKMNQFLCFCWDFLTLSLGSTYSYALVNHQERRQDL